MFLNYYHRIVFVCLPYRAPQCWCYLRQCPSSCPEERCCRIDKPLCFRGRKEGIAAGLCGVAYSQVVTKTSTNLLADLERTKTPLRRGGRKNWFATHHSGAGYDSRSSTTILFNSTVSKLRKNGSISLSAAATGTDCDDNCSAWPFSRSMTATNIQSLGPKPACPRFGSSTCQRTDLGVTGKFISFANMLISELTLLKSILRSLQPR